MKKIYTIIISTLLFLIISLLLLRGALRTEEARIRRNLSRIESLLSKEADEPIAAGIIRANRTAEYFTQDCRINVNGFNITGKAELSAIIHNTRAGAAALKVRFHDVNITIRDEGAAEVFLTAAASSNGLARETIAREVRLIFLRRNGSWKIDSAETVEVLR